jgi:hypothetical protein
MSADLRNNIGGRHGRQGGRGSNGISAISLQWTNAANGRAANSDRRALPLSTDLLVKNPFM